MTGRGDDAELDDWYDAVRGELIPKLEESAMVVSLVPDGEGDVKFAVELGLSIMLDKPIIAVVRPGVRVPDKLIRVADHIIEADITTAAGRDRLGEMLRGLVADEAR